MDNDPTPAPPQTKIPIGRITFSNLQIIIVVAFFLATLFTAWTPGESFSFSTERPLVFTVNPTPSKAGAPTDTPRARPLIGIVAGHWGNDSGTVCDDGFTEGQLNLTVASLVQKFLANHSYDVDLFKEFDPKLNGYKASALISIHADSCQYLNDQATGFKVAAAYASPHLDQATRLAACLRNRYSQATGLPLHSTSITKDMTSYHAFNEINENTPAAIIEVGFLNLDRSLLTDHTDLVVQGIVNGIVCFINNEEISPQPTQTAITRPTPTSTQSAP